METATQENARALVDAGNERIDPGETSWISEQRFAIDSLLGLSLDSQKLYVVLRNSVPAARVSAVSSHLDQLTPPLVVTSGALGTARDVANCRFDMPLSRVSRALAELEINGFVVREEVLP